MTNSNLDASSANPIASAVASAAGQLASNPTVAGAEVAVETAATGVAEAAAETVNPALAVAVSAFAPSIIHGLVSGLFGLFMHLGAGVPSELAKAKAELDKVTHGVL